MITLAIDPGVTSGWALFRQKTLVQYGVVEGAVKDVWLFLEGKTPSLVVMESFRLYPHAAANKIFSSFPEIETIGVIRLWVALHGAVLVEQSASQAKQAYSDAVIRQYVKGLNLPYPTSPHMRDAIRHGLYNAFRGRVPQ